MVVRVERAEENDWKRDVSNNNDNGDNKGPDPRIPRFNFNNRIALISLLILVSFFVFFFVYNDRSGTSELPYSTFQTYLDDGQIDQVKIIDQYEIQGTFKSKIRATSTSSRRPFPIPIANLMKTLKDKGVKVSGGAKAVSPLAVLIQFLPWVIGFFFIWFMFRQVQGNGNKAFSFGKSRAKRYLDSSKRITFGDVAGQDEAKYELQEVVEFLKSPQKFARLGAKIPKGVLLVGMPGHGKDPARKGRRGRGERGLLPHVGLRFRGDVRRRRREPRARPLRAGQTPRALHPLHRRAGRRGPHPRRRLRRRPRRARADPQPDARRDGRVRHQGRRHHPGGHQPARRPGPRPAAARPVRPAGRRGHARHQGARADPAPPRQEASAGGKRGSRTAGPRHARLLRRGPGQPRERGGAVRRAQEQGPRGHGRLRGGAGQDPHGRRAQEQGHPAEGEADGGLPRGGPRAPALLPQERGSAAQDHHHPARQGARRGLLPARRTTRTRATRAGSWTGSPSPWAATRRRGSC